VESIGKALEELKSLKDLDFTKPVLVIDLETTGLDPKKAQITQIGAGLAHPSDGFKKATKTFSSHIDLNEDVYKALEEESVEGHSKKLEELGLEQYKGQLSPHVDSAHWLLAYNSHHPHNKWEEDENGNPVEEQMHGSKGPLYADLKNPDGSKAVDEQGNTLPDTSKPRMYRVPKRLSLEEINAIKEDAKVHGQPTEKEALIKLVEWIKSLGDLVVCGHNVMVFDWVFLNERLAFYGLPKLSEVRFFDTMWVARLVFIPALETIVEISEDFDIEGDTAEKVLEILKGSKSKPSSSLQSLRSALKISGGAAHTALGDVETTIELLHKLHKFIVTLAEKTANNLTLSGKYQENSNKAWDSYEKKNFKY
jgi:DNA polymerase III epsilon subunit-like protein